MSRSVPKSVKYVVAGDVEVDQPFSNHLFGFREKRFQRDLPHVAQTQRGEFSNEKKPSKRRAVRSSRTRYGRKFIVP